MKINFITLLLIMVCNSSFGEQILTIGADEWLGYTHTDGSGVYFKLIKKIYPNYQLNFKTDAFNRTLAAFNKQQLTMVMGVYREDVNKAIFPNWFLDTEYPIVAFFDKKRIKIEHLNDFNQLRVSWLRGYNFDTYLPNGHRYYLVNDVNTGFRLLAKNRIDAFLDFPYNLNPKKAQKYSTFEVLPARHIYVAFLHNKQGQQLAKQFDEKMLLLRNSGQLAAIFGDQYKHSKLASFNPSKKEILIYTDSIQLLKAKKDPNFPLLAINKILTLIFDQLDNYSVEYKITKDFSDIFKQTKNNNVCFDSLLSTPEREQHLAISDPVSLYMGIRLYSKKQLVQKKPISLLHLLQANKNYSIGIVTGRSYGKQLDADLSLINYQQKITGAVSTKTLLKQLNSNRFDFIIEYPSVVTTQIKNMKMDKLLSYPLTDVAAYTVGHLMCSNSKLGEEFINQFNKKLHKLYKSEMFFKAQATKISTENKNEFIQYFNKVFRQ